MNKTDTSIPVLTIDTSLLRTVEREGKEDILEMTGNTVSINGALFRVFSSRTYRDGEFEGKKISVPVDVLKLYPVKASAPVKAPAPAPKKTKDAAVAPVKAPPAKSIEDRMAVLEAGMSKILAALG